MTDHPYITDEAEPETDLGAHTQSVERVAKAFHDTYEAFSPMYGYLTRRDSSVPWEDVPGPNRDLMCATVSHLLGKGIIQAELHTDIEPTIRADERAKAWQIFASALRYEAEQRLSSDTRLFCLEMAKKYDLLAGDPS